MKKVIFAAILFCMAGLVKVQAQAMPEIHETLNTAYADDDPVAMQQFAATHTLNGNPGRTIAAKRQNAVLATPAVSTPAPTPAPAPAPVVIKKTAVVARRPKLVHDTNSTGHKEHRGFLAGLFHKRNPNPCPQF